MIIFLYGPDDFRRSQKKKYYINLFREKHQNAPIEVFDCKEKEALSKLSSFASTESLFSKKRLAELENVFESNDDKELIKLLKQLAEKEEITILITEDKKPVKKWNFLIEQAHTATFFEELSGVEWRNFIEKEAKSRGIVLENEALSLVGQAYQGDTWRLVTELDKLALLGEKKINVEDVSHLSMELTPDFWEMLNGLKSPNQRTRLHTLEVLFAHNEPAGKIFNIAAYSISGALTQFAEYDRKIKSGKLEYEEALLDMAL